MEINYNYWDHKEDICNRKIITYFEKMHDIHQMPVSEKMYYIDHNRSSCYTHNTEEDILLEYQDINVNIKGYLTRGIFLSRIREGQIYLPVKQQISLWKLLIL